MFVCKSNPASEEKTNSGIVGTWLWKSTSGGIHGNTTTPTGNDVYELRITNDSNFTELKNDTITFTDKITTYQGRLYDSTQTRLVIDFINSKRFSLFVMNVPADSLILSDLIMDGYTSIYKKRLNSVRLNRHGDRDRS